jgi:hypothetical protein
LCQEREEEAILNKNILHHWLKINVNALKWRFIFCGTTTSGVVTLLLMIAIFFFFLKKKLYFFVIRETKKK